MPGIHTEILAWGGGGGGGERDQVHAWGGGGGGGGGVLCDIPPKKSNLMRIAIEGPDLSAVNFDEVLDIFKQKNR